MIAPFQNWIKPALAIGLAIAALMAAMSCRNAGEPPSAPAEPAGPSENRVNPYQPADAPVGKPASHSPGSLSPQVMPTHAPDNPWAGAPLVDQSETPPDSEGHFGRVRVVQPTDLPYPVRIEEKGIRDPVTGAETILSRREMVANRVLVKMRQGHAPHEILELVQQSGGRLGKRLGSLDIFLVLLDPANTESVPGILEALNGRKDLVEFAEPDFIARTQQVFPNDPDFTFQWGKSNAGQTIDFVEGTPDADVDAPEAWEFQLVRGDAENVVVAVIDTGILYTHQDLSGNMWSNPGEVINGVDDDGNGFIDDIHGINAINGTGDPLDDNGHGTHCAGIIGAVGNNGVGIAGMAWDVQLMGLKFLSASGSGSTADMIQCVNYAVNEGADIISASFGGGGFSLSAYNAINFARSNGVIFVAAAGNDSFDNDFWPTYPSNYNLSNIVSVASTTNRDTLSSFSNYGDSSVDIAAPGSDIYSTYIGSDSAYRSLSGTSMATPQVAGALALLKAEYPLEELTLIDRLLSSVDPLDTLDGKLITGGRLNVNNAIRNLDPGSFPRLEAPLEDIVANEGEAVTFTVNASGDDLNYRWTKDGALLHGQFSNSLTLAAVTSADSGRYAVRVFNGTGEVTSSATLAVLGNSEEVARAVDDEGGQWRIRTLIPWISQNTFTYDGVDAAASGDLADNQSATMERMITGPGTLQFYWKVSSERSYDFLRFSVNGSEQEQISGQTEWERVSVEVPEGEATLTWSFEKDYSISLGEDRGYVDAFIFTPENVDPPTITRQPENLIGAPGDTATFTVEADGSLPLDYQWYKDSNALVGATSAILNLDNISAEDAGRYQVSVTNPYGSTLSNIVELVISANEAPRILEAPRSQTVNTGATVTFNVRATGTNPLQYQWYRDGVPLSGATQAFLTLASVADEDVGDYTVSVSNSAGAATSQAASLRIVDATVLPVIQKNPESQTVVAGSNVLLFAEVSGAGLSYQWYKDGVVLPDQTGSSLLIFEVARDDSGQYAVEVFNGVGTIRSEAAWVNVLLEDDDLNEAIDFPGLPLTTSGASPWFSQSATTFDGSDALQSGVLQENESSTLSTQVEGPGALSFEWKVSSEEGYDFLNLYLNGTLVRQISGATDWALESVDIPEGTVTITWEYKKDLSVSAGEDAGWIDQVLYNSTSSDVPRILRNPESTYAAEGDSFSLSVDVANPEGATILWRRNGSILPGAVSPTLTINQATLADTGTYSVVVSNAFGSNQSRNANVTVFSATNPFGQALDNEISEWATSGDGLWFAQNIEAQDQVDSLQTPVLQDGEFAALATLVEGPGVAVFWWKASSEASYDELDFFLGDTYIDSISGETGWKQKVVEVNTVGTEELYWQYVKDDSISSGQDTAWIDQLAYFPSSQGPAILLQPQSQVVAREASLVLSVGAASRSELSYQWYSGKHGDIRAPLLGANQPELSVGPVLRAADYWVRVSDTFGSVDSQTATILVQGEGIPSRFPDAIPASEDWYYLDWLGPFKVDQFPWIYTATHGWWYVGENSGLAEWFFDPALGWLFTNGFNYPYLWSISFGDWIFFEPDAADPGTRYFYIFSQSRWITVTD